MTGFEDPFGTPTSTPQEAAHVHAAAALLTKVAHRLDVLLAGCTPGPWELCGTSTLYMDGRGVYTVRRAGRPGVKLTLTAFPHEADLIVTLVNAAPALVAWLRNAAREAEETGPNLAAMSLARVVLGEAPPPPRPVTADTDDPNAGRNAARNADFRERLAVRYADKHGLTVDEARQRVADPDNSVFIVGLGMLADSWSRTGFDGRKPE